jgi:hypothetical protein
MHGIHKGLRLDLYPLLVTLITGSRSNAQKLQAAICFSAIYSNANKFGLFRDRSEFTRSTARDLVAPLLADLDNPAKQEVALKLLNELEFLKEFIMAPDKLKSVLGLERTLGATLGNLLDVAVTTAGDAVTTTGVAVTTAGAAVTTAASDTARLALSLRNNVVTHALVNYKTTLIEFGDEAATVAHYQKYNTIINNTTSEALSNIAAAGLLNELLYYDRHNEGDGFTEKNELLGKILSPLFDKAAKALVKACVDKLGSNIKPRNKLVAMKILLALSATKPSAKPNTEQIGQALSNFATVTDSDSDDDELIRSMVKQHKDTIVTWVKEVNTDALYALALEGPKSGLFGLRDDYLPRNALSKIIFCERTRSGEPEPMKLYDLNYAIPFVNTASAKELRTARDALKAATAARTARAAAVAARIALEARTPLSGGSRSPSSRGQRGIELPDCAAAAGSVSAAPQ